MTSQGSFAPLRLPSLSICPLLCLGPAASGYLPGPWGNHSWCLQTCAGGKPSSLSAPEDLNVSRCVARLWAGRQGQGQARGPLELRPVTFPSPPAPFSCRAGLAK